MSYRAPLTDMLFTLDHIAGLSEIAALPGYEEVNRELVEAVYTEAAKMAEEVLTPLNRIGDQQSPCLQGDVVTTAPGFREAYRQLRENGWISLRTPTEYGGQGMPAVLSIGVEEMCVSASTAFSLCQLLTLGTVEALAHHASAELRQRYLPKLASGEWCGTMNLTEPQAGSDLAQVRTRAEPVGDGSYHIRGQKIFITWGEHDLAENIVHLVLARLPDAPAGVKGISLFVVPKFVPAADGSLGARNDVHCVSLEHKLGIHGSPTCVMHYGDGAGALGWLVGEPHKGLAHMFTMMNHARLGVGLEGLAVSERAYQLALTYAQTRVQSRALGSDDSRSVPIVHHPDVQRMLMSMRAQIEAQRALTYMTAAMLDLASRHPNPQQKKRAQARLDFLIPIVKGWNTDQANEITSLGVQIHGGAGYIEESGAAQLLRDARIMAIYEGTTGIQALDLIGRKTAADQGAEARRVLDEVGDLARRLIALPAGAPHPGETLLQGTQLQHVGRALQATAEDARCCVDYVVAQFGPAPRHPAAGSVYYLHLLGIVLGGWQLGRAALVSWRRLAAGEAEDAAFYRTKCLSAIFYAHHQLSRVAGLAHMIQHGADSTLAMQAAGGWDAA